MFDALVFDLDDTLCRYRREPAELLTIAFASSGVEPFFTAADYYAIFDEYTEDATTIEEIREGCFGRLAREAGVDPAIGHSVARVYSALRDQSAVDPLPGALEVIEFLDMPLGLVTNGPRNMQSTKLSALGIEDAFDHVVYAGFETAAKPDPEPFERVLDALETSPARTLHVGNSLSTDILGATNAGMRAAWLPEKAPESTDMMDGTVEPDYVLESLHDIRELLDPDSVETPSTEGVSRTRE